MFESSLSNLELSSTLSSKIDRSNRSTPEPTHAILSSPRPLIAFAAQIPITTSSPHCTTTLPTTPPSFCLTNSSSDSVPSEVSSTVPWNFANRPLNPLWNSSHLVANGSTYMVQLLVTTESITLILLKSPDPCTVFTHSVG